MYTVKQNGYTYLTVILYLKLYKTFCLSLFVIKTLANILY